MDTLRTPVCGDLVKEYRMIRVMAECDTGPDYEKYVPGKSRWLVGEEEVTGAEAELYRVVWGSSVYKL